MKDKKTNSKDTKEQTAPTRLTEDEIRKVTGGGFRPGFLSVDNSQKTELYPDEADQQDKGQ